MNEKKMGEDLRAFNAVMDGATAEYLKRVAEHQRRLKQEAANRPMVNQCLMRLDQTGVAVRVALQFPRTRIGAMAHADVPGGWHVAARP